MTLDIYQVDAFADEVFKGNPAVVCPLKKWLSDELMQKIASENSVSETAFFVRQEQSNHYDIRWFSPKEEVELCGHATLAAAYIIFNFIDTSLQNIIFHSIGGNLEVIREEDGDLSLILNALMPTTDDEYHTLFNATIGEEPLRVFKGLDYILVYDNEEIIRKITPRFDALKSIDLRGICITAKGNEHDFVYRFFAPKLGVNEDFITGSACVSLAPLWAKMLKKDKLSSAQLSQRGNTIICELIDDEKRVSITGKASLFQKGEIYLPDK